MSSDRSFISSVTGLLDGVLDTFIVCSGPSEVVQQLTPQDAGTLILESVDPTVLLAALETVTPILPTSNPMIVNAIWNNAGVLSVSTGLVSNSLDFSLIADSQYISLFNEDF